MYHSLLFIRVTLRHIFCLPHFILIPERQGFMIFIHYPEQEIHIELFQILNGWKLHQGNKQNFKMLSGQTDKDFLYSISSFQKNVYLKKCLLNIKNKTQSQLSLQLLACKHYIQLRASIVFFNKDSLILRDALNFNSSISHFTCSISPGIVSSM